MPDETKPYLTMTHTSRTPHGTMKLRDLASGRVIERWAADAVQMVGSGAAEWVHNTTPVDDPTEWNRASIPGG